MAESASQPVAAAAPPEDIVEAFAFGDGPSLWQLSALYNAERDEYTVPEPPPEAREMLAQLYLLEPGATLEEFDAAWPQVWKLTRTVYRETDPLLAILDTGVLTAHPLLRGCIRDTVDLTGEGIEDRSGHGTLATLIARMAMTGLPRDKFVIIKCIGADARGTKENLIEAMRWMQRYNAANRVKIGVASMSLGAYSMRMGLFPCDGTCAICTTAVDVSRDIAMHVAAGNRAGKTACPARAAFLPSRPRIVAEGRTDETTSGRATHAASLWQGGQARTLTLRRS